MVTFTAPRSNSAKQEVTTTTTLVYQPNDRSDHAHRQLIGYIGLLLPLLLIIITILRDGVARWRYLNSISSYYYTGAVAAFVGMLVALALFLFTYRGYKNKYYWADQVASKIAAIAALGVAFAVSWLVKGYALPTMSNALRSIIRRRS